MISSSILFMGSRPRIPLISVKIMPQASTFPRPCSRSFTRCAHHRRPQRRRPRRALRPFRTLVRAADPCTGGPTMMDLHEKHCRQPMCSAASAMFTATAKPSALTSTSPMSRRTTRRFFRRGLLLRLLKCSLCVPPSLHPALCCFQYRISNSCCAHDCERHSMRYGICRTRHMNSSRGGPPKNMNYVYEGNDCRAVISSCQNRLYGGETLR